MEAQNFSLYLEKKKYFKSEYILASAKIVEEKKSQIIPQIQIFWLLFD
jgi:hypothetical protein